MLVGKRCGSAVRVASSLCGGIAVCTWRPAASRGSGGQIGIGRMHHSRGIFRSQLANGAHIVSLAATHRASTTYLVSLHALPTYLPIPPHNKLHPPCQPVPLPSPPNGINPPSLPHPVSSHSLAQPSQSGTAPAPPRPLLPSLRASQPRSRNPRRSHGSQYRGFPILCVLVPSLPRWEGRCMNGWMDWEGRGDLGGSGSGGRDGTGGEVR